MVVPRVQWKWEAEGKERADKWRTRKEGRWRYDWVSSGLSWLVMAIPGLSAMTGVSPKVADFFLVGWLVGF